MRLFLEFHAGVRGLGGDRWGDVDGGVRCIVGGRGAGAATAAGGRTRDGEEESVS